MIQLLPQIFKERFHVLLVRGQFNKDLAVNISTRSIHGRSLL